MFGPGLLFIFRAIIRVYVLLACISFSLFAFEKAVGRPLSIYYRCATHLAVISLLLASRTAMDSRRKSREMVAMGATTVPVWKGKWPGNFDLLIFMKDRFDNDYLGAPFQTFVDKLGTIFSMDVFGPAQFFTVEPEHIKKQILASEFTNFVKGDEFDKATKSVFGTGIFNSDGERWKFHRTMTRPFFTRERISDFDTFDKYADETITLLSDRFDQGVAVDIQDVFARFTLDVATEALFGSCVHSLNDSLPYPFRSSPYPSSPSTRIQTSASSGTSQAAEFSRAFAEAQSVAAKRLHTGFLWRVFEIFRDKTTKPMMVCNNYLEPFVIEALKKKATSIATSSSLNVDELNDDDTLLDYLVRLTSDRKTIKDEIFNMMVAGRDTTACTLTFAVYLLAMHPEVMKRLRSEVIDKVGNTRSPDYDDMREMKYLRAVINETLRLFPPVPFNIRSAIESTTLKPTTPNGYPYYVPAGTHVIYSVFLMHRRPDLWGPDAMDFDPDRFLDERLHKYLTPNPFIFLPFNAGPRICLGQQFAYNEASFMLVKLLQSFDAIELDPHAQPEGSRPPAWWKNVPGRQGIEQIFPKTHTTLYSHGGVWVRMRKAANKANLQQQ